MDELFEKVCWQCDCIHINVLETEETPVCELDHICTTPEGECISKEPWKTGIALKPWNSPDMVAKPVNMGAKYPKKPSFKRTAATHRSE